MTQLAAERCIPALYLALVRPAAAGEETLWFDASAIWDRDDEPLRAGQFMRIGWELLIVLEVGERWVCVAPLDDHHPISHDVERMEQVEMGEGWYRLTPTGPEG
jgi:hypothetical protein